MNQKHLIDKKLSSIFFVYIWVLYVVVCMTTNCFSAAMTSIVHEGIMTKTQTGSIMALFWLVYAVFQRVGGRMADRHNPEKLLVIGLIGSSLANLIIYMNQNYGVMLLVWALNAAIQFGVWPSVFKIVSSQLEVQHRKTGMFFIMIASTFGMFLAYVTAMFVKEWEYNFLLSAILLFVFALGLYLIFPFFEQHMVACEVKEGLIKESAVKELPKDKGIGNVFTKSGFNILLPVFVLYTTVMNSVKTFSATMLMESYATVSPFIGNFLNVFIILSGLIGIFAVKYILYPRVIKEELKGLRGLLMVSIPFLLLLLWLGRIQILFIVISLAVITMLSSGITLLRTYYCMRFARFGKDAEAAGLANAGDSLGIVIQNYGITFLADRCGWNCVTKLWLVLMIVALAVLSVVLPKWLRFENGGNRL